MWIHSFSKCSLSAHYVSEINMVHFLKSWNTHSAQSLTPVPNTGHGNQQSSKISSHLNVTWILILIICLLTMWPCTCYRRVLCWHVQKSYALRVDEGRGVAAMRVSLWRECESGAARLGSSLPVAWHAGLSCMWVRWLTVAENDLDVEVFLIHGGSQTPGD